jgi:TonB family protein
MRVGSSPQKLPDDIAVGDQTVLETEGVLYASFLNRIADEIYDSWIHHIRLAMDTFVVEGKKLPPKEYITRLAITMDESGRVLAIRVLESSGVGVLDEAPKKAFWEKDPFPNPPEQMRREDGSFQFSYGFRFELRTSTFSIVPQAL